MDIVDIDFGLTFYSQIPPASQKDHLGIAILNDDTDVQYCYCTSQEKIKRFPISYYTIPKEKMKTYFPNSVKDSYIVVLSQNYIINMLRLTLVNNINVGVFENKGFLDDTVFNGLIKAILAADTISEEFKKVIKELYNDLI
jgi:hypothetical protein